MLVDISLTLFLLSIVAGYLLGVVSGLIPGIHTNNFALILLAISPILSDSGVPVFYVAVIILSNSLSHTFHDSIYKRLIHTIVKEKIKCEYQS